MVYIYIAHVAATLYMTGLIWFVQIVHYPLMGRVDREGFAPYEKEHQRLTAFVVGPPMLIEALTAVFFIMAQPPGAGPLWAWGGLALVAIIWVSTTYLQVPLHNRLGQGFDASAHRALVTTNWIRTAAWSIRALWALYPMAAVLRS